MNLITYLFYSSETKCSFYLFTINFAVKNIAWAYFYLANFLFSIRISLNALLFVANTARWRRFSAFMRFPP